MTVANNLIAKNNTYDPKDFATIFFPPLRYTPSQPEDALFLPNEIGLQILRHLTLIQVANYLEARGSQSLWNSRFAIYSNCLTEKTCIDHRNLRIFQRMSSSHTLQGNDHSTVLLTPLSTLFKEIKWPKLKHLDLSSAKNLTEEDLIAIFKSCPNLITVKLAECANVTKKAVQILAQSCPNLTSINLSFISFSLGSTTANDATGASTSFSILDGISLPNLEHLDLSSVKNLTEEDLTAIFKSCPNLIRVDLSHCANVNKAKAEANKTIETLAQSCGKLTSIFLVASYINDVAVDALAKHCPDLTQISLSHCEWVSDQGFQKLAQSYPNLISISVVGSREVTDATVKMFATHCPELTEINLTFCPRITKESIPVLVRGCKKLTKIRLGYINNLNKADLESLRTSFSRSHPNLDWVF